MSRESSGNELSKCPSFGTASTCAQSFCLAGGRLKSSTKILHLILTKRPRSDNRNTN